MNPVTVSVNTLAWPSVSPDILNSHVNVMRHLGIEVGYTLEQVPHGTWMDQVLEHSETDIVCFLDVDCVFTNMDVFERCIDFVATSKSFIGNAQVSNHIKPASHIFAAPSFFMIWRETWKLMNKPSFQEMVRCDVGENVSYTAEMLGVRYKTLFPTHYCKAHENERWFLHTWGETGIGTLYEGGVFHLFQGRKPKNQELFKKVCDDIVSGVFSTQGMLPCHEI